MEKFFPEDKALMEKMHAEGKTYGEIAERFACRRQTVAAILKKRKQAKAQVAAEDEERFNAALERGDLKEATELARAAALRRTFSATKSGDDATANKAAATVKHLADSGAKTAAKAEKLDPVTGLPAFSPIVARFTGTTPAGAAKCPGCTAQILIPKGSAPLFWQTCAAEECGKPLRFSVSAEGQWRAESDDGTRTVAGIAVDESDYDRTAAGEARDEDEEPPAATGGENETTAAEDVS